MASPIRTPTIIEAAYHMIAERGLEGFRIRALAKQAGINHATLLHYFPSKQAVIEAVVGYLLHQLQQEGTAHGETTPREALRHEFDDFRHRLLSDREFFIVLSELQLRAYRDPLVATPLTQMYAQWHQYLTFVIHQGIASGQFRADVPVAAIVEVIIGQFRGLALSAMEPVDEAMVDDMIDTFWAVLIQWLMPLQTDHKRTEGSGLT
ncbi:MAG: TetR/AcrR family transcriptional regulator [Chloroflexi bacterium]|nr:TetR/AcrR family transcriptional regulator [Chloroflexota bacterium]